MSGYRLLNIILTGVLGFIFLYSGFFVDTDYALTCYYRDSIGIDCVSCGFSRDFAAYTHLDFSEKINSYSGYLFLFFLIQFIVRLILISINKASAYKFTKADGWFSGILFIFLFGPYLKAYVEFIVNLKEVLP